MHDQAVTNDVLLLALDCAADAIAILGAPPNGDPQMSRFEYVNRAFEELYQCSRSDVIGVDLHTFFSPRSTPKQLLQVAAALSQRKPFSHTRQLPRPDGTKPWIHVKFQPFDGGRWIYIIRDVSDVRLADVKIAQLLSAVERATEPIAIYSFDGAHWRYDFVNEAFLTLTGFDLSDLLGTSSSELITARMDVARIERNRELLLEGESVRGEVELHRKDGSAVYLEFNSKPLRDEHTQLVTSTVSIFHDVTQSRLEASRLLDRATRDSLTGLYNRHYMEHALQEGIDRLRKGTADQAFIFVDLDGFKAINDHYGHERGDEVLRAVSEALKSCTWSSDVLARWGGDEFAALVLHCNLENAAEIGQRMIDAIKAVPEVGASVGVTMLSSNASETVRRADNACYAAKRAGGNRVVTSAMV